MAANMAKSNLFRQRDDSAFESFNSCTVELAKQYTDDSIIPRYKRPRKRFDGSSQPHYFTDVNEFYRIQYYEVLDLLIEEILRRFYQASLALPAAIEDTLIKSMKSMDESPVKVLNAITKAYSKDINMARLKKQLQMFADLASTYKSSQSFKCLNVASVRTVCEIMH